MQMLAFHVKLGQHSNWLSTGQLRLGSQQGIYHFATKVTPGLMFIQLLTQWVPKTLNLEVQQLKLIGYHPAPSSSDI
jgi:hypothetical protein